MVATFLSYWSGRPIRRFDGWSVAATVACLIILGPILGPIFVDLGVHPVHFAIIMGLLAGVSPGFVLLA